MKTALLFTVLGVAWVAGLNSHDSVVLAQASTWFQETAGAIIPKLEERRKQLMTSMEGSPTAPTARTAISSEDHPDNAGGNAVLERISEKMDQVQASSEAAIDSGIKRVTGTVERSERDVLAKFDQLQGTVERSERTLLAKLDQLQERLDAIERHSVVASTKEVQTVEQSSGTPPTNQATLSIQPTAVTTTAPRPAPIETKRVENWAIKEVVNGTAILEGPRGLIGVSTGNVIPGVGRVESISRRGGRWIVATSRGVITTR
jgi:hypothetical protein